MKLHKVLIFHKKSTFQIQAIDHRESRFLKLLDEGHEAVNRVKVAHAEHLETMNHLEKELQRRRVEFRSMARSELDHTVTDVDLMITVGGDGTFLDASHYLRHVPILGINSSSSSSFGHFCMAHRGNLDSILDQIESGSLKPSPLLRLEVAINGAVLPEPVLNEVLIAHSNPAATSRYYIRCLGIKEEQRSSGIWVSTPAGSTGSLRSAGGTVEPITETNFQYIVREPCMRPGETWQLLRGTINKDEPIKVISQMRTGMVHLDGQHIDYQFGLGDELVIRRNKNDLLSFISESVNDQFLESQSK